MTTLLRRMRPLMGCYIEVAIAPCADERLNEIALRAAFEVLARCAAAWSFHESQSLLSRLNAGNTVMIDPATERLLRLARGLTRASDGLFDCTVGGELVAAGRLPDHGGPAALLRGKPEDIVIGRGWASLARPVWLTLDGIAKGLAVDLAIDAMRRHGVAAGIVNAGGDLRVFGDLTVPIERREVDGSRTPLGRLRDAAVASSRVTADDADTLEADAISFPALLIGPPGTVPTPGVWTVLARRAWRADALAKVAAVAPASRRADCVAAHGGLLVVSPESQEPSVVFS